MTKNRIEMQPIWDIEQEILDVIDNICQRIAQMIALANIINYIKDFLFNIPDRLHFNSIFSHNYYTFPGY